MDATETQSPAPSISSAAIGTPDLPSAAPGTVRPRRLLFGVPIDAVTMTEALQICREAIEQRRQLVIGVVNAAKIVKMRHDPLLRDSVLSSDMILADGAAVVWASRLLRQRLPERVAGIDLFEQLLAVADQHGYSVFFLGAEQDVLDAVLARVRRDHPNLRIAGSRNGYFSKEQSREVAEQIAAAGADLLFLAMTSPKKEIFQAEFGRKLNVRVCHGVGGSFDVFGGKIRRAPMLWQRLGCEWLYRVVQEPRRMWKRYLVTNTLFLWMVGGEMLNIVVGRARLKAKQ